MEQLNTKTNELNTNELDAVSGGFIWIPVVVGGFLLGTAIRMGIDKVVEKVTK
jgi:bacteriocin-like protein